MYNTKKKSNKTYIKSQLFELGEIWIDLTQLVTRHLWITIMAFFVLCVIYSKLVFSLNYYTDTEMIINNPYMYYNWMEIGRFGLVLLKKLGELSWYNPYFEAILFLIFIWFDVMFIALLCTKVWNNADERVAILAGLVSMIYPTYAEQFGFRFQAFEIVFSIFVLLLASIYLYKYITVNNKVSFVISIILSILAYGIYQSNVNLQLTIYMFLFASCTYGSKHTNVSRNICIYISHFLISFVLYELIANCIPSDAYLAEQVMWGKEDVLKYSKLCKVGAFRRTGILHLYLFYMRYSYALFDYAHLQKKDDECMVFIGDFRIDGFTIIFKLYNWNSIKLSFTNDVAVSKRVYVLFGI